MNRKRVSWLGVVSFMGAIFLTGCSGNDASKEIKRGRTPWVFRSVLDKKARIITMALNENLWVAYDAQNCAIYKVWQKGVLFDGPVYTTAHGPQPSSIGVPFFTSTHDRPWVVEHNKKEVAIKVHYKGHYFKDNQAIMQYELALPSGEIIKIEETPEYFTTQDLNPGLERKYVTEGVPTGTTIKLKVTLASLLSEDDITADSDFSINSKTSEAIFDVKTVGIEGILTLNNNASTTLSTYFYGKVAEMETREEKSADLALLSGDKLMERTGCNTCHNAYKKTVGPALIKIAAKYESNEQNIEFLTQKVISGGSGNWGTVPMNPHPDLPPAQVTRMVSYILSLGTAESSERKPSDGLAANIYVFFEDLEDMPKVTDDMLPAYAETIPLIAFSDGNIPDLLENNFAVKVKGYINIEREGNYVFRLVSDDGSWLYIDDQLIIANGGLHGDKAMDGELTLKAGKHRLAIDFFQSSGGKSLKLLWAPYGTGTFSLVPPTVFSHDINDLAQVTKAPQPPYKGKTIPGDKYPLQAVHPSFDLKQVRPDAFLPKVGGMDFMPNGDLIVCTWDSLGSVYRLIGAANAKNNNDIEVKRIAMGLAEPLGLKVVDDEIYILQKQELTRLVDMDGDMIIDGYQTVCNGWKVSANFHEFAFGLAYKGR